VEKISFNAVLIQMSLLSIMGGSELELSLIFLIFEFNNMQNLFSIRDIILLDLL
jgi:hypothetical protein